MKTTIDLILSLLGIILLSPFLVILGLIILFAFGSPVFFIQIRPGHRRRLFEFFKFRTMTNTKNGEGDLLPDKNRLTPLGSFLSRGSVLKTNPKPLPLQRLSHY